MIMVWIFFKDKIFNFVFNESSNYWVLLRGFNGGIILDFYYFKIKLVIFIFISCQGLQLKLFIDVFLEI